MRIPSSSNGRPPLPAICPRWMAPSTRSLECEFQLKFVHYTLMNEIDQIMPQMEYVNRAQTFVFSLFPKWQGRMRIQLWKICLR
jgi:hypothetical protein